MKARILITAALLLAST
jgi:cathepsin H